MADTLGASSSDALTKMLPMFAIGGGIGNLFGSSQEAGLPDIQQIQSLLKQYLGPYAQSGTGAMSDLQKRYAQMLGNPGQLMNQMGAGYQQSPGYQFALKQQLQGAGNAAAAGGMAGSPMHEQQNMGVAQGLANQDYYNYLDKVMGLYGGGLQGEQGLYQGGLTASGDLSTGLSNALLAMAQMKQAQAQQQGQGIGGLIGGVGSLFGFK